MRPAYDAQVFAAWLDERVDRVEGVLAHHLPRAAVVPAHLHEAMRYAVLGGGKRIRASLVYAAGELGPASGLAPSAQEAALDHAAAAVELIHAYSLVHDDLPCMDDDALRRGRPTVHLAFDEATAMLAGDALQPLAFELLAAMPIAPALVVQASRLLAQAAGSRGMVGGQAIDCLNVGQSMSHEDLRRMHQMKTGALLQASVLLGGIVSGASSQARRELERYAVATGLAFQVMDDILDVTADTVTLGKTAGKDEASNKPTMVSSLGLDGARALLAELAAQAHAALRTLGPGAACLAGIVDAIVERER
ncbi:MAG: polyprenyl synthetase family protein [Castellaniella sp.]